MARPRKGSSPSISQLSAGQAQYILGRLVADRRVSSAEVNRYVADIQREITDLEQRLESLRSAAIASGLRRRPGRPPAGQAAAPAGKRRRRRSSALSPEQRASRQLQGRYLGLIRQIPKNRRGQYTKIAKEKGREAAIREMQSVLNK